MICPKCRSNNVLVQQLQDFKIKNKHHSIFWWIFVGWYWVPIKWIIFTVPALFFKLFGHKKQKIVAKTRTVCTCQKCGYSWEI